MLTPLLDVCLPLYSSLLLSYLQTSSPFWPSHPWPMLEKKSVTRKCPKQLQYLLPLCVCACTACLPSAALRKQPVLSLKGIASTYTPAHIHHSNLFPLSSILFFSSWLNYLKSIQVFYFSHLKKWGGGSSITHHYLFSFRRKLLGFFFNKLSSVSSFSFSLESSPIRISPHMPPKPPSRLSLSPHCSKPIINSPSSSYLKGQQYLIWLMMVSLIHSLHLASTIACALLSALFYYLFLTISLCWFYNIYMTSNNWKSPSLSSNLKTFFLCCFTLLWPHPWI